MYGIHRYARNRELYRRSDDYCGKLGKYPFQVIIAVLGIVLTLAYLFKMMRGLFYGELAPRTCTCPRCSNICRSNATYPFDRL